MVAFLLEKIKHLIKKHITSPTLKITTVLLAHLIRFTSCILTRIGVMFYVVKALLCEEKNVELTFSYLGSMVKPMMVHLV